jgi:hypothetical protein
MTRGAYWPAGARRRLGRIALLASVAVVAAGAAAGEAHAGQIVYSSGTAIWAMNDDGSAKRQLVDASQVPGMEYLGNPSVQPNGTEVAFLGRWDQAYNEQNKFGPAPGFCGGNCEGIYELSSGAATRITNAPFDCPSQPCESQEVDPRVGTDGSVAYVFNTYVSEANGNRWDPLDGQSGLFRRDSTGHNQQGYQTQCEGTSGAGEPVTDADVVAPNPASPGRLAYGNCRETSDDNGSCVVPYATAFDVYDSGPSAASSGDDVLMHSIADPNAQCLQDAGTAIGDLDYSPDGSHIVELHGGSGAGIYTYSATANGGNSATELLALPHGWLFYSVRYLGSGRIGFTAGTSDTTIGLYSMATTCTPGSCDVTNGTGITTLASPGSVSDDYILNTAGFGWTSSTAAIAAVTAATSTTTTTTTRTTTTSTTPSTTTTPGKTTTTTTTKPPVHGPTVTLSALKAQRVSALLHHGLALHVTCTRACTLTSTLWLGKTALGSAHKRLTRAGRATLTLTISRKLRKRLSRLRRATLKVTVHVSGSGTSRTVTRTFTVRR